MVYYNNFTPSLNGTSFTPSLNGTDTDPDESAVLTVIRVFLLFFSGKECSSFAIVEIAITISFGMPIAELSTNAIMICIISVFSILERFSGTPGAGRCCCCMCRIFPVDLLSTEGFRFGHAAAFGCTSGTILYVFLDTDGVIDQVPSWSKTLVLMALALEAGLQYYPLSYCLTTPWVFLGSISGFLYAGACFGLQLYLMTQTEAIILVVAFPQILCYVALLSAYIYRLVNHVIMVRRSSGVNLIAKKKETYSTTAYNKQYVRDLFNKQESDRDVEEPTTSVMGQLFGFLSRWIYQNDPNFRYSTRILSVTVVSLICAYQIGSQLAIVYTRNIQHIEAIRDRLNERQAVNEIQLYALLLALGRLKFFEVLSVSGIISFLVASIFTVYSIGQILVKYRRNLRKMFQGSYRHLPFNRENTEAHVILSSSLEFAGAQVAYILWGYLIVFVTFTIICILVAYLIILLLTGDVPEFFLQFVVNLIPLLVILVVQKYLKTVLCKRMFLQTRSVIKGNGDEEEKTVLALKNSQCYHNVSYFMFFFYAVIGIFGCLLTIIKSIVLGVFYLARLDQCTLCQGFETWDRGYMIYLSFLYVEASHRHPVVLVFCDLLINRTTRQTLQMKSIAYHCPDDKETLTITGNLSVEGIVLSQKIARNRWLKAYTLIKNPCLIKLNDNDDKTLTAGITSR